MSLALSLRLRGTLPIVNLWLSRGSCNFAMWAKLAPRITFGSDYVIQSDGMCRVLGAADLVGLVGWSLIGWPLCVAYACACWAAPRLFGVPAWLTGR